MRANVTMNIGVWSVRFRFPNSLDALRFMEDACRYHIDDDKTEFSVTMESVEDDYEEDCDV